MPRPRPPLTVATAVVALAAVAFGAVACSSGGAHKAAPARVVPPEVQIPAGPVDVARAGAGGDFTDAQAAAVRDTVARYLSGASVEPFSRSAPPSGLETVFTADALTAATGVDRAALTDADLPGPTANPKLTVAPVAITALLDANGAPVYASATIDQQLEAPVAGGIVGVRRAGDLVLEPCAAPGCPDGAFRVRAYSILVQRTLPDGTTTTTAVKK